jgi:hypothetical protein
MTVLGVMTLAQEVRIALPLLRLLRLLKLRTLMPPPLHKRKHKRKPNKRKLLLMLPLLFKLTLMPPPLPQHKRKRKPNKRKRNKPNRAL